MKSMLYVLGTRRYYGIEMKPLPPPPVPGNTEFEKFDNAVEMMFSVPREALVKAEAERKQAKAIPSGAKRKRPVQPHS